MENPIHQRDRNYSNALDAQDVATIGDLITQGWKSSRSLVSSFARALDDGCYLASERQWYRIGNLLDQQNRPTVTTRKSRKAASAPVLVANAPLQVWMWDITDFKGPYLGVRYKAYSVQDLFSRKIVAWAIHPGEADKHAVAMFEAAFLAEGIPGGLHADNGAVMTSGGLAKLCHKLKITMTFNRPSVSNDNAFKESEFRTLKTRPDFPGFFKSINHAERWMAGYVEWFNNEHHHSGIGLHTPNSVHTGQWLPIQTEREKTITDYHHAHPERYRQPPVIPAPPAEVWINFAHSTPQHRPAKID
ncbi:transposase [Gordonia sp. (in: high G+C Gram-positive bacteria)]|uniref:transposase n=1 Tax=Gordonia sp. (in: high G+C Gram-positive bacteria) TaxID=84139 RepID=UPI003C77014F